MRIKRISLQNFRGFRELDIELNGKSTVFFGVNGVGKSSILRAIDLVYANIIGNILGTKKRLAELNEDDIYDHKPFAEAKVTFDMNDGLIIEYFRRIDTSGKRTHDRGALIEITEEFRDKYLDQMIEDSEGSISVIEKDCPMPIFVNYGVNRAVIDDSVAESTKKYVKQSAFDNAIESKIDFKSFFLWFKQQEDLENELIARMVDMGDTPHLPALDAVRCAMLSLFDDFKDVRYDRQLNTITLEKSGERLKISQLSDGEKCAVALFGDIARRMAVANGNSILNPLLGNGVVLIDEVDLHLHPLWQRKIVNQLTQTFPNIQFVITTHSPSVLGEITEGFNVFSIDKIDQQIMVNKANVMYGWDVNIILREGMKTPEVNDEVQDHIENMYRAYDEGDFDKAIEEADVIDMLTNGHNDHSAGVRAMIARRIRKGMVKP